MAELGGAQFPSGWSTSAWLLSGPITSALSGDTELTLALRLCPYLGLSCVSCVSRARLPGLGSPWPSMEGPGSERLNQLTAGRGLGPEGGSQGASVQFKEVFTLRVAHDSSHAVPLTVLPDREYTMPCPLVL